MRLNGASGGSSPLARGLLAGDPLGRGQSRIIPARAGFTPSKPSRGSARTDHPRSRGVYGPLQVTYPGYFGSSPLARGLPHHAAVCTACAGIIPARAGFTSACSVPFGSVRDHPRSRGVYPGNDAHHSLTAGSSPLARGLLADRRVVLAPAGIIPARAGFTETGDSDGDHPGDHPRSRGVYGLDPGRWSHVVRIIPARAGFTPLPDWRHT